MRRSLAMLVLAAILAAPPALGAPWAGVDETVIEKAAAAAGRPARPPLIDTDQGDLLLFVFLLAGIGGGFVAGYHFRTLFPPRGRKRKGTGTAPAPVDPVALGK